VSWREYIQAAVTWFALGFAVATGYHQPAGPPVPVPDRPVPTVPVPVALKHNGHFTISYIEPRYPSPASAAVRNDLANTDWHALDATFRAYTLGQAELTTLGLDKHFDPANLPIALIQETGPKGAPIVATVAGPASAGDVLGTVKGLRGL